MLALSSAFRKAADFFFSCSPLYQTLARQVAEDPDILALAASLPNAEQATYLLFASVLHALKDRRDHPLARFYAVLTDGQPAQPEDAYAHFAGFVRDHRAEIETSLATRPLNRSIPRRAMSLYPMVQRCAADQGYARVTLVDIGCGAGFNLLPGFCKRVYTPDDERHRAEAERLSSITRGKIVPPAGLPQIGTRVGIDLALPDLGTDDDRQWILSQLIAEDRQSRAVASAMLASPELAALDLRRGDAVEAIESLLMGIEADDPIVIMHSVFIHYLSPEQRAHFIDAIARCGRHRPVSRVAMEIAGQGTSLAIHTSTGDHIPCGRAEIDATWLQWTLLPA